MTPPGHPDDPDLERLAAVGRVVAYFGYGSLVNRNTLQTRFLAVRPARLAGWRRVWLSRSCGRVALLSVRPDPAAVVDGVVVFDRAETLGEVDRREANYDRRSVLHPALAIDAAPVSCLVHVYVARPDCVAGRPALIWQSYLDAVMQGFLFVHGEAGLCRFVFETAGFETDVLCDRAAPLYPRAVRLRNGEAARFDALLRDRGVRFVETYQFEPQAAHP